MADTSKLQSDASGKLKSNAAGKLLRSNTGGGCCCEGTCTCDLCENPVFCSIAVDAADIDWELCDSQCIGSLTENQKSIILGSPVCTTNAASLFTGISIADPNGTFDPATAPGNFFNTTFGGACTTGDSCQWGVVGLTDNATILLGCGGGYGGDSNVTLVFGTCYSNFGPLVFPLCWQWVMRKDATTYTLAYCCTLRYAYDANTDVSITFYKFYSVLESTDCDGPLTFDNQLPGCGAFAGIFGQDFGVCDGCNYGVSLASGGTAVVTFV